MQRRHPDGQELIAVGYIYNSKVTLCFIVTKNVGSTREGDPYEMKFTDDHGTVHVRLISQPALMSHLFQKYNCVVKHNQAHQYKLGLKKKWETRNPYFCMATAFIGVNVVDTCKLST